jgi:hypothetical protein
MDFETFSEKDLESLTQEQREKIKEYQMIHTRLRILKSQMAEIQEETHELIENLEKLRQKR